MDAALIRKLDEALAKARMNCAVSHPPGGLDVGFFFGEKQGQARGIAIALKIVENFFNEASDKDGDMT